MGWIYRGQRDVQPRECECLVRIATFNRREAVVEIEEVAHAARYATPSLYGHLDAIVLFAPQSRVTPVLTAAHAEALDQWATIGEGMWAEDEREATRAAIRHLASRVRLQAAGQWSELTAADAALLFDLDEFLRAELQVMTWGETPGARTIAARNVRVVELVMAVECALRQST